ncbi:MAG: protocatechuate 3,4-dioxygenase subunit beta [Candidatus Protistobacter heckmanni]|nr:protocatechuate 3,4-dioxygenase subunit beta [Candidatus Protistobacter heckmanni]
MPRPYRKPYWDTQPEYHFDPYASTPARSPAQPLIALLQTRSETTGPTFPRSIIKPGGADLTRSPGAKGEALGERIVVSGRVLDESGRPVRNTLVEVWQANSSGRYVNANDQHDAPLDPNFLGEGRTMTDDEGRYRVLTVKPGPYPWRNHYNAWRPAHIHFSLFGNAYTTRLVTQMYFPCDPLLPFDPIFNSTADVNARNRLISCFDWETAMSEYATGYRFDIVLRGQLATPWEK